MCYVALLKHILGYYVVQAGRSEHNARSALKVLSQTLLFSDRMHTVLGTSARARCFWRLLCKALGGLRRKSGSISGC